MEQGYLGERRATLPTSFRELRRPLRRQERHLFRGADTRRDSLDAIGRLLKQGDERSEAVAKALAYALIYRAMTKRLSDRRWGAVPKLVGRLRKAVDSFEASIR